jgi:hypothetical protein
VYVSVPRNFTDIPNTINLLLAVTLHTTRFNIKKFYVVPTLRLCVLYGSQNKQQLLPYTALTDWFFIAEVKSVYSAVRTESLYEVDTLRL